MENNKYKFFIDTANVEYIKKTWEFLQNDFFYFELLGITTNPNAFNKEGLKTLEEWENRTKTLAEVVTNIYKGQAGGAIHVQLPISSASPEEAIQYARRISTWGDGITKISMKIPPFPGILKIVNHLQDFVDVNVTGLSDYGNALRCVSYGVDYISIIPGRMEEKSIFADEQILFLNTCNLNKTKIITGSMRTLFGLRKACMLNTIPTIGTRVFDEMFKKCSASKFREYWSENVTQENNFSPFITPSMVDLSVNFFNEMDKLGSAAFSDFKQSIS